MHMLHTCPRIVKLLSRFDVLALTHTGTDGEETAMPGYRCVCALQRSVDPTSGGVAVFVRERLWSCVRVERTHPELGLLWVRWCRDGGEPVYICVCYLPHQASSYYTAGEGLDRETHWSTLCADISHFAALGSIMLLGDTNSRVGRLHDVDVRSVADLEAMEPHTGVVPSVDSVGIRELAKGLPQRNSMDRNANAMGRALIQVCRACSLVILNGRLPGDTEGAFTFFGPRRSRSVIDYVIVSPRLAFTSRGAVKRGCCMTVCSDIRRLPRRPGARDEGQFDHVPVGVTVRVKCGGARGARTHRQPQHVRLPERWAWRPELREAFIEMVKSEQVQAMWRQILPTTPADQAVSIFRQGLRMAVEAVHARMGRVICSTGGKRKCGRVVNQWYDASCKEAHRAWKEAVRQHGRESLPAQAARRAYFMHVRRVKRAHEFKVQEGLVRDLYQDPKQFWKHYQTRVRGGGSFTVAQWTEWFEKLLSANTAGDLVGGSVDAHCAAFADLFPQASEEARGAAEALNRDFTVEEVNTAMASLACGKAAGVDGVPAEFLQQAYTEAPAAAGGQRTRQFLLAPTITQIFNAVLQGCYPEEWRTSALSPVPKPKGQPDVFNDHRGVAVSPVLGKLYSIVWTNRIDRWAEQQGLRATGQAGFRAGRGTPDNCFVLRHLLDVARIRKKRLYCAFIDFSKAYDRVSRPLLLRVLASCGMHGRALHAIASMLEVARLQVRANGQLGLPFESTVGVKQGDPASPVFFGIFIDRLEVYLARHCTEPGAELAMRVVRALLYADDVVLTSESAEGLQEMLDRLGEFCTANSMFVNQEKSEVVVFGGSQRPPGAERPAAVFTYNGVELPTKSHYIYLGLRFEDGQPARLAIKAAVARARKALHAMFSRCYALKVHNADLQCHLFDSLVMPALSYGCEVWAVDWLSKMCRDGNFAAGEAEEGIHRRFLRQCLGVCKSTPAATMYADLGRLPVSMHWLRMAAKLWNRALSRGHDDWLRLAVEENVRLAGDASVALKDRRSLWAWHFMSCMDSLGIAWRSPAGVLLEIPKAELVKAMRAKWEAWEWRHARAELEQSPGWAQGSCAVRAAPESFSRGFKLFVYDRWFAVDKWVRREHWSFWLHSPQHIRVMAQFRMGSHWLEIQKGRGRVGRSERCCSTCAGCIEDELHVLECPQYDDIRRQLLGAVPSSWTDSSVKSWMNKQSGEDWRNFAEFLLRCRLRKLDKEADGSAPRIPSDQGA